MKRIILSFFVLAFPYTVMVLLYAASANYLPKDWTMFEIIGCILITWLIGLVSAVGLMICDSTPSADAYICAKQNMLIKLLQIPAYIALFVVGSFCTMLVFTWGVTIAIIITDAMTIFLSGVAGVSSVAKCGNSGTIRAGAAAWLGVSQFIYVVDVICAIALFVQAWGQRRMENAQKINDSTEAV